MNIQEILIQSVKSKGSDLFIIPGSTPKLKIDGKLNEVDNMVIMPEESKKIMRNIYMIAGRDINNLSNTGDDDFSFSIQNVGRFRCNAYKQRNSLAAVIRIVAFGLPDYKTLHIPDEIMNLYKVNNGIILITGPAGCGKSTTQACLIDKINTERDGHIITLEDPIEFMHHHKKSLVSQREIGHDTESLAFALRSALRQTPDVIQLGEMRDPETIQTAFTAAETGELVISTLHTVGAVKSIERIIDIFPPNQQAQIRIQLSMVLKAVISQQLLPTKDGKTEPAFEILIVNPTVQNMIREGKMGKIDEAINAGKDLGMRTMNSDILRLYNTGIIEKDTALTYAANGESTTPKTN